MLESTSKEIGKTKYLLTQFGAKKGRSVLLRLFKVLGPGIGVLAQDTDKVADAIRMLSESIKEEDLDYLCDEFAKVTKVYKVAKMASGDTEILTDLLPMFDSHFRNAYGEMFMWLAQSIHFNFADFLVEIQGADLSALGLRKAPQKPLSPTE